MKASETNHAPGQESLFDVIRKEWNTVPNFLSYFRILLIPVFVALYFLKHYQAAAVVIVLSLITDILDGQIARRFHMISRWGKALDPLADKLTQVAMFICISSRYRLALLLAAVVLAKEITIFFMGLRVFRRNGSVEGARWFGKLATGVIVISAFLLVLLPGLEAGYAVALLWLSIGAAAFSYLMYLIRYIGMLRETK
ncbi:MAG: CDP-alcohol phosphatidyltransferase family protein [bacterium]